MDSMSYNFTMEEQKSIFTTASDTKLTTTSESFTPAETRSMNINNQTEGMFRPQFLPKFGGAQEMMRLLQQEPLVGSTAPTSVADAADMISGSDLLFDDLDQNSTHNFYMGSNRAESVASAHTNLWSDATSGGGVSTSRNGEMMDTFDFLVKSLSSANNYVSMLTREQLFVLRSIRPSLLYEFLQEVAKVRGDRRMRRALPNECAFCKNNGENEECYSSHALKDWRGRVLCPVLRAFRCPRCGATGDRAHTIKYCNVENSEAGMCGGLPRRRAGAPGPLVLGGGAAPPPRGPLPAAPAPAPAAPEPSPTTASMSHSSPWWTSYGIN